MSLSKRAKKFGAVLTLVSALSSACAKELSPEEFFPLKSKFEKVQRSLQAGEVDKSANKELVKIILKLRKEGYALKGINFPRDFDKGMEELEEFYRCLQFPHPIINVSITNSKFDRAMYTTEFTQRPYYTFMTVLNSMIREAWEHLRNARKLLGFVPEDEKELFNDILNTAFFDFQVKKKKGDLEKLEIMDFELVYEDYLQALEKL